MPQSDAVNNQRKIQRVSLSLPVEISFGSQITLMGRLKDISLKSAFVAMKSSVYMQLNDEVGFSIQQSSTNPDECVQGMGRISRVAVGEGIAIYFVKMDETSSARLKELLDLR